MKPSSITIKRPTDPFHDAIQARTETAAILVPKETPMRELTQDDVARVLRADFETGKLYWLPRTPDMFPNGRQSAATRCAIWNSRYAGKEAFTSLVGGGYLSGEIFYRAYFAHRVLWMLAYGEWPAVDIDHINGDRSDNRLTNLRSVSRIENGRNQGIPRNNKSGVMGVCWSERNAKWKAQIRVGGDQKHLGFFPDIAAAAAARKAAEIEFGFHPNHGERRRRH